MNSMTNRIMFAEVNGGGTNYHIIMSKKGDRRNHFEWLSSQYISWEAFKNMNMGYLYEEDDNIYLFHGQLSNPIEKVSDILFIMNKLLEKMNMDKSKTYHVYNGINGDKPIIKMSINLADDMQSNSDRLYHLFDENN